MLQTQPERAVSEKLDFFCPISRLPAHRLCQTCVTRTSGCLFRRIMIIIIDNWTWLLMDGSLYLLSRVWDREDEPGEERDASPLDSISKMLHMHILRVNIGQRRQNPTTSRSLMTMKYGSFRLQSFSLGLKESLKSALKAFTASPPALSLHRRPQNYRIVLHIFQKTRMVRFGLNTILCKHQFHGSESSRKTVRCTLHYACNYSHILTQT